MKLTTKHFFPFIKMINQLDIKSEIKNILVNRIDLSGKTEEEKQELMHEKGIDITFLILEKLPNAEKEVFEFLALYSGKTVEDIKEMELAETMNLILGLFKDQAFTSFFRQATK